MSEPTLRLDRRDLLVNATEIAEEYAGNLTLRQLYYQLVARGLSPNSQKDYKRIGEVLASARMSGAFPFTWLMDRGRTVHSGAFIERHDSVEAALEAATRGVQSFPLWYLSSARWWGQSTHVSVWVEKEALAGVFERPCNNLGVGWFACKGYPSLSSLYQWVKQVESAVEASRHNAWLEGLGQTWNERGIDEIVIVYFGDHDPDGWEIPRSAYRNVVQIATVEGIDLPPIRLERVALNMAQIREHDPPPYPAKPTSSRFKRYHQEHATNNAWELDALRPEVLDELIRQEVGVHFDNSVYEAHQDTIRTLRSEMRDRMRSDGWLRSVLPPTRKT